MQIELFQSISGLDLMTNKNSFNNLILSHPYDKSFQHFMNKLNGLTEGF